MSNETLNFPENFLWGGAIAANRAEGAGILMVKVSALPISMNMFSMKTCARCIISPGTMLFRHRMIKTACFLKNGYRFLPHLP